MSIGIVFLEGQNAGTLAHWIRSLLIEGRLEDVNPLTLLVVCLWEERSAAAQEKALSQQEG